ncbi:MAG TPA: HlyD family efflux transporter periplasmic adaptor subunit [Thermoanaerobaculia bacterium]|nr:HlyD family efflux transporter periplasmic adaptor subunit [Thermoanaerobaculia bacterium]
MDIARIGQAEKRRKRNILIAAGGLVLIGVIFLALRNIQPAAPPVERQTVWIDTVQRGSMLRQVRGSGTLVPVDVRWISASVEGRVERIPNLPGITVTPETILLEMSNPEVEQNALEAEAKLKGTEADRDNLRAQLDGQLLNQEGQVAQARSAAAQARLQADANEQLSKDKLIPEITLKISLLKAEELAKQVLIEVDKYKKTENSAKAQVAAQQSKVDQDRGLFELRRRQVDSLKVRSGIPGVLQELPVQVGQRVTPGTTLARVARPERLKAQLRIPETQAKDVAVGQKASIDTRNGLVDGHVARVAPSVSEGTVLVDVALDGALPQGARTDLSVDGTIEIERLENVLYVGRPAYGQAQSKIEMFKLVKGGKEAIRVPVWLGRSSVNTIEIVKGLNVGDQVILSDTSAQDSYDRIRLN